MLDVMEIDIDRPEKIVYVVGLGPGEPFYMTQQAANTLESVDAICGYKVYLDLIRDEFPCEEYYATGMTLYNPSSKGRPDYLAKAVCILLENGKSADTVCGIVRNIGREGQTARILTLAQLESITVDMFTTVYIGNAATKQLGGRMVTPRGYRR